MPSAAVRATSVCRKARCTLLNTARPSLNLTSRLVGGRSHQRLQIYLQHDDDHRMAAYGQKRVVSLFDCMD